MKVTAHHQIDSYNIHDGKQHNNRELAAIKNSKIDLYDIELDYRNRMIT